MSTDPESRYISVFAPTPYISKRTRLVKIINQLVENGYTVQFYGWERVRGESEKHALSTDKISENVILRGGGYATKMARLMYVIWMAKVFFRVLFMRRDSHAYCLGWECAFPAVIASYIKRVVVIFDDADRFSLILKLPGPLHRMVQRLERWTSRKALVHIVPSFARYEWRSDNMLTIKNSPSSRDIRTLLEGAEAAHESKLSVYVNGWLGETRGLPILLGALKVLEAHDDLIEFQAAGRADNPSAEAFVAHPMVTYHGELPQLEALRLYGKCDVTMTYYDPKVVINRKAEPNKWGDCVHFRTPFVVNSEVETAARFIEAGAAFDLPYYDTGALADLLLALARDRGRIDGARQALESFRDDYPLFDDQFGRVIEIMEEGRTA